MGIYIVAKELDRARARVRILLPISFLDYGCNKCS